MRPPPPAEGCRPRSISPRTTGEGCYLASPDYDRSMDASPTSPVIFDPDGVPRSRRFGDVYFSREGGLAESRAVFLAGCGLPQRWAGRRRFVVAELGFGTGLNILALLEL